MTYVVEHYWNSLAPDLDCPARPARVGRSLVSKAEQRVAAGIAERAAALAPIEAGYFIGATYTVMLPENYRGEFGVFYTPPALTERLLDQAAAAGVDWRTARVLDPACGGGAFLAPVAVRMAAALKGAPADDMLAHLESHLSGIDIDALGAWMSQMFVEAAVLDTVRAAGRRLARLVEVRDSLAIGDAEIADRGGYDLVIGNPPYGRVTLDKEVRARWARSLYGHANIYGLFTDLAVRLARPGGVIAYVTPAGFLGGEYFKNLRKLLGERAPPVSIDFVDARKGVFADVLQEALLAVYRTASPRIAVSFLAARETGDVVATSGGGFAVPADPSGPWLLPRHATQVELAHRLRAMPGRLSDIGYEVSTGPLVWNRHKPKLHDTKVRGAVPLIWAECVASDGSGRFAFKAVTRNHKAWFVPGPADEPNIVRTACVLVQRTTALEQARRLIAAELPQGFIDEHGGAVSVENHLNMVKPMRGRTPLISAQALAALLNSAAMDQAFRCINGTPAVSAYEIEATPLPDAEALKGLDRLLARKAGKAAIEKRIWEMYGG
ncbi:MAG TPA: Eco57I restriction-modification methylase domain-containing protein [Azospirillum sp.]